MEDVLNFNDPRVRSRCETALDWVSKYVSKTKPNGLAKSELYKYFGNTSRPLGKYLKDTLLVCTDNFYNPLTHTAKKYILNRQGYKALCDALGYEPKIVLDKDLQQQLATGDFKYETKSNRDFNPVQYIPSDRRQQILRDNGYCYHYDIQAAAPTLILQRAQQVLVEQKTKQNFNSTIKTSKCKLHCPSLEAYINNSNEVRQQIATEAYLSVRSVKFVINALLNGSQVSSWSGSKIFVELHRDYDAIKRLQNSETLAGIRKDISKCWSVLRDEFDLDKGQRLSGRDKSGYYRELEEQVGKSIKRLLKKQSVRYLWLHDGWSCDRFIDPFELETHIRRNTGFNVKLEYAISE